MTSPCQAQDAPECSNHSLKIALHTGTWFNFSNFPIHKTHRLRVGITEPCENVSPERTFGSQRVTHLLEVLLGQILRPPLFFNDIIREHVLCDSRINPVHCWELWSLSHTLRTFPNFLRDENATQRIFVTKDGGECKGDHGTPWSYQVEGIHL